MDSCLLDELVDEVLAMGLKDTRQQIFSDWADALLNKDWDSCDTCAMLLIHTLSNDSEHRKTLEDWIDYKKQEYDSDLIKLQELINAQNNPFQREELKNKKPELDEWRAMMIHNKFFFIFKEAKLISD